MDLGFSRILPVNLTVDQKCEIWHRFSATSKQAGMLLIGSLQLCILTLSKDPLTLHKSYLHLHLLSSNM